MKEIKVDKRRSAMVSLEDYCVMSMGDRKNKGDYLEVTEWSNGEGFDINIDDVTGDKHFILTNGQFDALKACIKAIYKSYDFKNK